MTKNFERTALSLRPALLLALAMGGCVAFAGGGEEAKGNGDQGETPADNVSESDAASRARCRESTEKARAFLDDTCSSCHGGGSASQGGFATVLDVNKMIDEGKILPGKPETSPLYVAVNGGTMPPKDVTDRPSADDISYLHDWIDCGAPALARAANASAFIPLNERLETMVADLKTFEKGPRRRVRYIDLYNLANAGFTEEQLDQYREALSFLLNSLSRSSKVVSPQRVDDRGLLFRIELDDYDWTEETWAAIADEYPYAVQYEDDSPLFDLDEDESAKLRELTGEAIPYVQGDWFISHTIRPPLYYDILGVPDNLTDFQEGDLNFNIAENIQEGEVQRVGFRGASNSQNDRVLERHELSGGRGVVWISYDFADGIGTSNVFANPINFTPDGMQVAFSLKNGLLGFTLFNADGERLDKASNAIIQDPGSRDGQAEAGVSCLACHQNTGFTPREDEVAAAYGASGTGDQIGLVEKLYPKASVMNELFAEDAEAYTRQRSLAVLGDLPDSALREIDNRHLDTLDLAEVAAVLGIRVDQLQKALNGRGDDFPDEVLALRGEGVVVPRDGFEAVFPDVVRALLLGTPFRRSDAPPIEGSDGSSGADASDSDGSDSASDGSDASDADAGVADGSSDGSSGSGDGWNGGN